MNGVFTLKSAYSFVANVHNFQEVSWADYVCFKGCIKKHSLCSWIVLKKGLETRDFLMHRNVDCDSCCV